MVSTKLPPVAQMKLDKLLENKKLTPAQKKKIDANAKKIYAAERIGPAEAVGTIAAQSIGEPSTQGALRTFHFAGALSVSGGLDRAKELLSMARKIKTPQMDIYLLPKYAKKKSEVNAFIETIIEKRLKDIAKINKHLSTRTAIINFDKEALAKYNIKIDDLKEAIEKISKGDLDLKGNTLTVYFKESNLKKVTTLIDKLKILNVKGVKGITHAVLDDRVFEKTGEYRVITRGTNSKEVIKLAKVDPSRVYTNDIREVEAVFGIEAARQALWQELQQVYSDDMFVDPRHLSLLSDLLTFKGKLQAVGRTGVSGKKKSVLARASFEETSKNLFNAVIFGEVEDFKGVAENIIAGKIINVGTGTVKVMMK
ncbi:MAG: hypothetical protein GOV15_03630 [Candidatus Diapherotrites archaeon]|nr:hypothetical protein [Candidatus Diapherotrites archaeon]